MDLTLLVDDRPLAPRAIHRNFLFMTICFAVNHGCVISVLNLSVVLLGTEPGAFQTGSLYVTYAASALLFATPLLDALGSRRALVYASATYCVYVASVPLAMVVRAPWGLYVISCVGGAVGGVAAGFLWAAQGAYFSASAQLYAAAVAADGGSVAPSASPPATAVEGATSSLAAWFGAVFLACEVALKLLPLLLSAIPALNGEVVVGGGKSLRVGDVVVVGVYSILAIAAAVLMARVWDVDKLKQEQQASAAAAAAAAAPAGGATAGTASPDETTALRQPAAGRRWRPERAAAAVHLWAKRPIVLLLAPVQMAFGLCAALLGVYITGHALKVALPADEVATAAGLLSALVALVAAALQAPFRYIAGKVGKPVVMLLGLFAFAALGTLCLAAPAATISAWPALVSCYLLQGVGRACYEGVNKALYADLFAADAPAAFSNIVLANGVASAAAYFIFPEVSHEGQAAAALAVSALAILTFSVAAASHARGSRVLN